MSFGYKQHGLFSNKLPPISYIDDKRTENMPHEICELICLKCMHRWIGVYPETTLLKDIKCQCGEVGYVIKTGQTLSDVPDENMENDARFQNMVRMWGRKEAIEKYKMFVLEQK